MNKNNKKIKHVITNVQNFKLKTQYRFSLIFVVAVFLVVLDTVILVQREWILIMHIFLVQTYKILLAFHHTMTLMLTFGWLVVVVIVAMKSTYIFCYCCLVLFLPCLLSIYIKITQKVEIKNNIHKSLYHVKRAETNSKEELISACCRFLLLTR